MAYNKLSTANLPDPGIDPAKGMEPRDYFETFLYTGNGQGLQVGDVIKKSADTTTISNSLLFNTADNQYLSRTPSTDGSRQIFTLSTWLKRSLISANEYIFYAHFADTNAGNFQFRIDANGALFVRFYSNANVFTSSQLLKDTSKWYHVVLNFDTTESAGNRVKLWLDGVAVTKASGTEPGFEDVTAVNDTRSLHTFGGSARGTPLGQSNCYFAETHFVDGAVHEPTDFGNFDANGIWIPKTVTAVSEYGVNGYYLDFSDNTSTTTLGEDSSGKGNDWTLNNFATTDQVIDSPTDNVPYNISVQGGSITISEGNLKTSVSTDNRHARTSMRLPPTGKWNWEAEIVVTNSNHGISIVNIDFPLTVANINYTDSVTYHVAGGQVYAEGDGGTSYATAPVNDVVGVAFDSDTGRIWFRNSDGWLNSGDPAAGTGYVHTVSTWGQEDWFPAVISHGSANKQTYFNFGQRAFTHTVPTGFSAMTENNITVDDQNLESPDFVWIKNRDQNDSHHLYDSVRGVLKAIYSDTNTLETDEPNGLLDFNKNGFTIGSEVEVNTSGEDYVAWCWKTGTSFNYSGETGTIDSVGSVNTTSGVSIVTYTGSDVSMEERVKHGLSSAPEMIMVKSLSASDSWAVYHKDLSTNNFLELNNAYAQASGSNPRFLSGDYGTSTPTDTYFYVRNYSGSTTNDDSDNYVAYCFHSVEGLSKFGSYSGNNSTDGPFIYLGFRPALFMVKCINTTGSWYAYHTPVLDYNPMGIQGQPLGWDLAGTDTTADTSWYIDALSNGVKIRNNSNFDNASNSFIYMAFAENPFKYATAR